MYVVLGMAMGGVVRDGWYISRSEFVASCASSQRTPVGRSRVYVFSRIRNNEDGRVRMALLHLFPCPASFCCATLVVISDNANTNHLPITNSKFCTKYVANNLKFIYIKQILYTSYM